MAGVSCFPTQQKVTQLSHFSTPKLTTEGSLGRLTVPLDGMSISLTTPENPTPVKMDTISANNKWSLEMPTSWLDQQMLIHQAVFLCVIFSFDS